MMSIREQEDSANSGNDGEKSTTADDTGTSYLITAQ